MRWKKWVAGLALSAMVGCKQTCFLQECDYQHYRDISAAMPRDPASDPSMGVTPTLSAIPQPSRIDDPDRKLRFVTLQEAFAMALENGTTGITSIQNPGNATPLTVNFGRSGPVQGTDAIRVFSLDPAIVGAGIESSLSKFDAVWTTSATWSTTDQPTQGLNSFTNGESAVVQTGVFKPLPTGGVAGITFQTTYQDLIRAPQLGNGVTTLNPSYTPRLQFQFEQPLLQGYGIEINQLRPTHPGSILSPGTVGTPTGGIFGIGSEGILITRLNFDQQRLEFEKNVNFMLLNVETAYWNLYDSYWTLYANEAALRQAFEAWRITRLKFEAGSAATQDLAQSRQQYELFRGQRLTALGQVLESERQLRALLGLPGEDGTRLVPIDSPTLTAYEPDWNTAVNEALTLRPELIQARNDLKRAQFELILAKNSLLPDLRFTSSYALGGLGTTLDGTQGNAFRSLASDHFIDYSFGFRMNYLLGYRDAHAQTRIARLSLERSYRALQDYEQKAQRDLEVEYRHLFEFHKQIEIQRSQRLAAADQLNARSQRYVAGKETLDILLESQRVFAVALQNEFAAIRDYNNALAGFEFAKGTLLHRDNVIISEGALPHCAQVRAVEHERERGAALVLHERATPITQPCWDPEKGIVPIPQVPASDAAPVPALPVKEMLQEKKPLPEVPPAANDSSAGTLNKNSSVGRLSPPVLPADVRSSQSTGTTGMLMMEVPVTEKPAIPGPTLSSSSSTPK
jgi:outer membrane protein TolC